MKSSVHPKYKTQYHVGNWPAYDRALVQRGDITVWLAPDAIATGEAVGVGKRGGQRQYSDLAIETALTLRLIFHLPLRQTEGFLRRCCMIQLRREWGRFSNFSFRTPQRRISAYPARPSG